MAVTENTPQKAYTASGASAVFAYDFPVLSEADMAVTVDGAAPTSFSVSGVGNPAGGTVTIVPTPTAGQRVVLSRDTTLERTTDYQNNGDLLAPVLNTDFDRLWLSLQEIIFGSKVPVGAIRAPLPEVLSELPAAASRLDRLASFNASTGDVEISPFTVTQLASAIAAAYAGATTADGVGYADSGTDATPRTVQEMLRDMPVFVRAYGVVGDGVTDDTEALRAAHTAANAQDRMVSYSGVGQVSVDANAQIEINTSVDFAGCVFHLTNGQLAGSPPSLFNQRILFKVIDPACPLTTATDPLSGTTQLMKGNRFPTLGAFNGPGYALLTCTGFTVPNRQKDSTQAYTQSFRVFRGGESAQPISVDLSSHSATITVQYRKNSAHPIRLHDAVFPEEGWNSQVLFQVERNEVAFERLVFPEDPDTAPYLSRDSLIYIVSCSDIMFDDLTGLARNYDISTASYNINTNGGANIFMRRMKALNGWGCTGSNDINGLYVSDSIINRVDVHSSGHNVFVYNCDIHRIGVVYGWGGGIWSVKNCRVHRCSVLTNRDDYGGTFFGHIVIADNEVQHNGTQTYVICSLETLGASTAVYAPETITIRGVKRYGAPQTPGAAATIDALRLAVATPASQVVYAPDEITISDISSFAGWRIGSKIDILNMEAHAASVGRLRINLSGIHADTIAQTTTGIVEYPNARTPSSPVIPYVKALDVQNLYLSFTPDVVHEIICHSCDLNGINANLANTQQPYVEVRNCRLRTPVSGVSPAPLGGTTSAGTGHTILSNTKIYSTGFELQYIAAAQGCLVASGLSPTLPGGVAIADLFTGWVKSSTFA